MRTSLCIAVALLAATILAGTMTENAMRRVSDRYVSAAEELRSLTQQGQWERAAEVVETYLTDWRGQVSMLQMLINHEDTDAVTLSLLLLRAAIEAQDVPGCLAACAQMRENAQHLHHRDAFTLANVL